MLQILYAHLKVNDLVGLVLLRRAVKCLFVNFVWVSEMNNKLPLHCWSNSLLGQIVDRFGMLSAINFKTYHLTLNVMSLMENYYLVTILVRPVAGINKKPQKSIFEYWVFSQKSYLNIWKRPKLSLLEHIWLFLGQKF